LPVHGGGNDTPRSNNAKKAQSGAANDRPFGVALGLDEPEKHRQADDGFAVKEDEQLFEIKVSRVATCVL
jgi:hypothetical protein